MDKSSLNGTDEAAYGFEKRPSQCGPGSFQSWAGLSASCLNKGTNLKMMNRRIAETYTFPLRTLAASTKVLLEMLFLYLINLDRIYIQKKNKSR